MDAEEDGHGLITTLEGKLLLRIVIGDDQVLAFRLVRAVSAIDDGVALGLEGNALAIGAAELVRVTVGECKNMRLALVQVANAGGIDIRVL